MAMDVLTVSSKGQVVLPADMRHELSIGTGDKLAAYRYGDSIILKAIQLPTADDFKRTLDEAQAWAALAGLTEDDMKDAIATVRARHK